MTRSNPSRPAARFLCLAALAASPAVCQTVDLDPATPYTSNPAVAPLAAGRFLAVWTRDRRVPLSFGPDAFVPEAVAWQRRRSDGQPSGPLGIALPATASGAVRSPQVAATATGAQLVWARILGAAFVIEGRAMTNGNRLQAVRTLGGCPGGTLRGLKLVAAGQGSWLVWNELCDGLRIVALRLDGSGRPSGEERVLVPPSALPAAEFDAAPLGAGGFVATWVQSVVGDYGVDRILMARAHRGNGKPRGRAFRVTAEPISNTPGQPNFQPAVVATPAGAIRVAWPRPSDSRLVSRDFRIEGTPLGAEQLVGDPADAIEDSPRWAAGSAGGPTILLWQRDRSELESGCLARRIGSEGPQGHEVLVAARCPNVSAAISSSRLLVTWQEPQPEPADNGTPYRAVARSIALAELR